MLNQMMKTVHRTYKTRENAVAAIEKKLAGCVGDNDAPLRYVIVATEDGRFAPCLVGVEAIQISVAAEIPCVA